MGDEGETIELEGEAPAEVAEPDEPWREPVGWSDDHSAARRLVLYYRWSRHDPHAPTTGITVSHHHGETVYSLRSTTGRHFAIAVRDGEVVRENVTAYARPL